MQKHLVWVAGVVVLAALLACQTTPPPTPQPSAIQGKAGGFAPGGVQGHTTLDFGLTFGNADLVKTWKVEIAGSAGAVKTWTGDGTKLPSSLTWDGKNDTGAMAPEGTYTAHLSVTYQKTYPAATADSSSFVLDITPPTGSLAFDPSQLTPSGQGVQAPTSITITASSKVAKMDSWSMDILDPSGKTFRTLTGKWPDTSVQWDGTSSGGAAVAPNSTYSAVATVQDEFGNTAQLKGSIAVAQTPTAPLTQIQPRLSGFSPLSDTLPRSIDLLLSFGNKSALKSWKLSVGQAGQSAQKSWSGDASKVPDTVTWDGKTDAGATAPEGTYTARLSVDYGGAFQAAQAESKPFVLDVSPPSGKVVADPSSLTPDGKGGIQPMSFSLAATSKTASVLSWNLSVLGSDNAPVATFNGLDPAAKVPWDGTLSGGGSADPTKAYSLKAQVRDVYGNVGLIQAPLPGGALPAVTGTVAATAKLAGFSPASDTLPHAQTISLSFGKASAVTGWTLGIGQAGKGAVRTFEGDATNLPASVDWDGKADDGTMAPEGTYTASLNVSYGTTYRAASATSGPFALDVNPPVGSITLSAPLFSPMEGVDKITLTVKASSAVARIDSWTMSIYDPNGLVFNTFSGKWPSSQVVWDGKGSKGDLVQSAEDYPVVAKIRDEFGNIGQAKVTVPVDILVEKTALGYRILSSRIFFREFTADYTDVTSDLAKQNAARLDALAEKLKKFPGYKFRIVGHAVSIYWFDRDLGKLEQQDILIPLSKARADVVKKALVDRGLDEANLTTEGIGASEQLVPDSDLVNRWQNRRVAIYIEKEN